MKVFGHPVHLMLIHFPSALLPMECVCYGIYYYTNSLSFASASFYAMTAGVLLGWLAALFGVSDLARIPAQKPMIIKKALLHGAINCTVLIVYTPLAWIAFQKSPYFLQGSGSMFILKISLIIFMIAGNYLGGSLVLKHRVGTEDQLN